MPMLNFISCCAGARKSHQVGSPLHGSLNNISPESLEKLKLHSTGASPLMDKKIHDEIKRIDENNELKANDDELSVFKKFAEHQKSKDQINIQENDQDKNIKLDSVVTLNEDEQKLVSTQDLDNTLKKRTKAEEKKWLEEQAKCTGFPGDCSEAQLQKLAQFRVKVQELGVSDKYNDQYLLRFLRARKFDLEKTYLMFTNFLEWRNKNDVDNIHNFPFPELQKIREFFPHGYHKTDKKGRPIYVERTGKLKLDELFKHTDDERMVKYYTRSYEYLINHIFPKCTEAKGSRVDQTMTILDLDGLSLFSITKRVYGFIQLASSVSQDNYPEILGNMCIVNAPYLFSGVWSVVKGWLDPKTAAKIKISSDASVLLELIDKENLPDFLGGTSTTPLSINLGPWNPNGEEIFVDKIQLQSEKQEDEKQPADEKLNINQDDKKKLQNKQQDQKQEQKQSKKK